MVLCNLQFAPSKQKVTFLKKLIDLFEQSRLKVVFYKLDRSRTIVWAMVLESRFNTYYNNSLDLNPLN